MLAVTLKQIANACNVSTATVSKALNYASDIGAETAECIRKTARNMGYFPNATARALKTSHSRNLGVLLSLTGKSGLTHEYFAEILEHFKQEAEKKGYDITFINRNIGGTGMSYLEHCMYRNCDGLLIACGNFTDPSIQELIMSSIPLVTIDYVFDGCGSIVSDNARSMGDLVRYVHGKGHQKIALIYGDDTAVTRTRLASFYRTCAELGIPVPDSYVVKGVYHDPENAAIATRQLLALTNRPTCIMYPDDFSYIGGRNEIERQGLSIPNDISVTGFDGIYLARVLRPTLTTLRQDSEAIGVRAAQLLVSAIESPRSYIPEHIVIPGAVWEGNSVKQI